MSLQQLHNLPAESRAKSVGCTYPRVRDRTRETIMALSLSYLWDSSWERLADPRKETCREV